MRQRFDEDAQALTSLLEDASVEFLQSVEAPVSPLAMGHVALDMDVFPMDNSQTHKEGVSYTYKGYDGYAPIAAYLGQWVASYALAASTPIMVFWIPSNGFCPGPGH